MGLGVLVKMLLLSIELPFEPNVGYDSYQHVKHDRNRYGDENRANQQWQWLHDADGVDDEGRPSDHAEHEQDELPEWDSVFAVVHRVIPLSVLDCSMKR